MAGTGNKSPLPEAGDIVGDGGVGTPSPMSVTLLVASRWSGFNLILAGGRGNLSDFFKNCEGAEHFGFRFIGGALSCAGG